VKLIDTCGWVEWLTGAVLSDAYAPYFDAVELLMTPTSVQFELYKWVRRNSGIENALQAVALTEQTRVTPLTTSIALLGADLSIEHSLSFADAIIYASARSHQAMLVTSDNHFKGLPGVDYFAKT